MRKLLVVALLSVSCFAQVINPGGSGAGFTPPVTATQSANGANLEKFKRFTDTGESGFFELMRNAADNATLYSVDVDGNVVMNSATFTTFVLNGATSGTITLAATATAGINTATFPAATGSVGITTGALVNGNCAKFDSSGRIIDAATTCGGGSGDYAGGTKIAQWLPDGSGGWRSTADGEAEINGASGTNNAATSTMGYSMLYVTSGVINNSQGFSEVPVPWYVGNARLITGYSASALTLSTAEILHWVGFTDQTALTMLPAVGTGADNPAGNYAGIYLCNSASTQCNANGSKSNWFCVLKNGTTQTVADTGIVADTARHSFLVNEDVSNNWNFKIDGVTVCGAIAQTNKPTAASLMRFINGIDPLAAAAKRIAIEGAEAKGTK